MNNSVVASLDRNRLAKVLDRGSGRCVPGCCVRLD